MYCSPSSPRSSEKFRFSTSTHPLLQLMSLSATLHPRGGQPGDSPNTMLLKTNCPGSPPTTPNSCSSSGILPESPHSPTPDSINNNNPKEKCLEDEDGDEVLSIGRDNEDMELEEEEIGGGNEDPLLLPPKSTSTSPSPKEEQVAPLVLPLLPSSSSSYPDSTTPSQRGGGSDEEDRLSQNSQFSQSSRFSQPRSRQYSRSSEDSFSIKSLCSPKSTVSSTSPSINGGGGCGPPTSPKRAGGGVANPSLMFSIANILRPDFGSSPSPFVPQKKCLKGAVTSSHLPPLYKPYSFLGGGGGGGTANHHPIIIPTHQQPNPIDLSGRGDKVISSRGTTGNNNNQGIKKQRESHYNERKRSHQQLSSNGGTDKSSATNKKGLSGGGALGGKGDEAGGQNGQTLWPAWVYCTRYSDRPSSGPRARRERKAKEKEIDEKRPRTAFSQEQLARLKREFDENRYLTEKRRQDLARELNLHENQIKIWFQNKRAKLKKASGSRGGLALQLMAQGLYNHSTINKSGAEDEDSD